MQIITDLHIHSKYSRAVSPKMNLEEMAIWASKKGIDLIATADWAHPIWFREICSSLKEVESGIFTLKKRPKEQKHDVKFLLSFEISSIYAQGDKTNRRVHNLIFSPSLSTCEKIIKKLTSLGVNLISDGRPITGISSKNLIEIVLEIDEKAMLIPAHIWTPWFSMFGSNSGFDSISECFGDYKKHIYGIETGLSSDPIMNWQIKELENRSILSFSDAHSGPKIGREATVFVSKEPKFNYSYNDIERAIKQDKKGHLEIGYTIEFFPEEGKYHLSGHRNCNIKYDVFDVKEKGKICPVCKKPLTIGVKNRVSDLSNKILKKTDLLFKKNKVGVTFVSDKNKKRRPFVSIIPLQEILIEVNNNSKAKGLKEYERLTNSFGTEFDILLKMPYEEIENIGGIKLKKAIEKMRERSVYIDAGYDGVFGIVKVFDEKHEKKEKKQLGLF